MISAFRVRPYLHAPSARGVTIIWYSRDERPGTLSLTGPGAPAPVRSAPEPMDVLAYTEAELQEQVPGLADGSWLHPGGNVRHLIVLSGLRPGTQYTFHVTQAGERAEGSFTTAPQARWERIRIAALADSEVSPAGRTNRRSWFPGPGGHDRPDPAGLWGETFGVNEREGRTVLRYPLTEGQGYRAVMDLIGADDPDLILHPGDLVQGGGYQPAWDEFFRIGAGAEGSVLSRIPLLPAMGNWENFGALNGRYGTASDRSPVVRARAKYHAYFPGPEEPGRGYYRIDYGPLTILTLDSSNGEPDDDVTCHPDPATGRQYRGPGTDTQRHFTAAQYRASGGTDLNDIAPGSPQWRWVEQNLAAARAEGRIILVQFHHVPYSSGVHGLPMDHRRSTGQGGTPMRRYHPMFAAHGVVAVLCGHSELFERSLVDGQQGPGVLYYDVGVAGDSLGGELRDESGQGLLRYNPYRVWTADQDAPERWEVEAGGNPVLAAGGKHYGYLDISLQRAGSGARMKLRPVHAFPLMSPDYALLGIQRRTYDDEVVLDIGPDGRVTGIAAR